MNKIITDLTHENQPEHVKTGLVMNDSNLTLMNESLFGAGYTDTSDDSDTADSVFSTQNMSVLNSPRRRSTARRTGKLSFLTWNVEGLFTKLFDKEFVSFVSSHDFVCLTESFLVDELKFDAFPEHDLFYQHAKKITHQGRPSGGVVCLVNKSLTPLIKQIKVDIGIFVLLYIDKTLFNVDKDVLYVCAYVPPEGSQYYNAFDIDKDGISLLENCLVDNVILDNDVHIIVNGDLNSRTSNVSQTLLFEQDHFDFLDRHDEPIKRSSQDKVINSFGKSLLSMCTTLDLCIVNGTCNGDRIGRFTYISDNGCSVDDYFLMSCALYASLFDECDLIVLDRIECKHLPVKLTINTLNEDAIENNKLYNEVKIEKYRWTDANKSLFLENISKENFRILLNDAMKHITININIALNTFNECIKEAAVSMKTLLVLNKRKERQWFDHECIIKRREVRKLLRNLNKSVEKLNRIIQRKEARGNNENEQEDR